MFFSEFSLAALPFPFHLRLPETPSPSSPSLCPSLACARSCESHSNYVYKSPHWRRISAYFRKTCTRLHDRGAVSPYKRDLYMGGRPPGDNPHPPINTYGALTPESPPIIIGRDIDESGPRRPGGGDRVRWRCCSSRGQTVDRPTSPDTEEHIDCQSTHIAANH